MKSIYDTSVYITREMIQLLNNEKATPEKRLRIFLSIVNNCSSGNEDWDFTADSLREGFKWVNNKKKRQEQAHRDKSREYQRKLRNKSKLSSVDGNCVQLPKFSTNTIAEQIQDNINIPLNPPSGVDGRIPEAISAEDILGSGVDDDIKDLAIETADEIEETEAWVHMQENRGRLMKCLVSIFKKKAARKDEILDGIEKWTAYWKSYEWRYAPEHITSWLYDGKWKQEPRKKEEPYVAPGCGPCGVEIV